MSDYSHNTHHNPTSNTVPPRTLFFNNYFKNKKYFKKASNFYPKIQILNIKSVPFQSKKNWVLQIDKF